MLKSYFSIGLLTHIHLHAQYYYTRSLKIRGRWCDIGNLTVGGSTDLELDFDIIFRNLDLA